MPLPRNYLKLQEYEVTKLIEATLIENPNQKTKQTRRIEGSMEMTIQHFSHEHPLILDRMENIGEICNACSGTVNKLGFVCSDDCGFLLHKSCTMLPQQTLHHLHPQHPLKLNPNPSPHNSKCSLCEKTHLGFVFQCDECQFNIDVNCFSQTVKSRCLKLQQKTRKLQHFSHPHSLVLRFMGHGSSGCCRGCAEPVSGPTYCCSECPSFFLHKSCAQLQERIQHPFHQSHPLLLLTRSPYHKPGSLICDGCRNSIGDNFFFHCPTCQFDLDVACVTRNPSVKDPKHEHALALFEEVNLKNVNSFSCKACSKNCVEYFYRCVKCNFNIHSSCLTLQSSVKHKNHPHTLLLKDFDVKDGLDNCASCRKIITPKHHRIYHCAECGYGLHLGCVESDELHEQEDLVKLAEDMKAEMKAVSDKLGKFLDKHSSMAPTLMVVGMKERRVADIRI